MKSRHLLFFLLLNCQNLLSQPSRHGVIQASANGHYLQYADGTPFFWLGDTGWEMFHRLSYPEINTYLENRRQKGFSVIQAVLLAEFDGLRTPDRNGDVPLLNENPATPNERYFLFVDSVVALAASKGLVLALLPTWGDKVTPMWGTGPQVFDSVNAFAYGAFLSRRYGNKPEVVWVLGGDRPAQADSGDWRPVWRQLALGLLSASPNAFITYHPSGGSRSSAWLQQESWLDMNMMQSGHGSGHDVPVWNWITADRNLTPAKPTLDAEPNYEDHPVNPWPKWDPSNGYFRAYDVRKQCYRSVFAGAAGVTYGHHAVWQFWSPREEKINYADRYWTEALDRPGAAQVGYLKKLILSRPPLTRVPDSTLIVAGQGSGADHAVAFRDSANTYAMIYMPRGKNIAVDMGILKTPAVVVWWFNPRTGAVTKLGQKQRAPVMSFTPPELGNENDWVLVLDAADATYPPPGQTF